MAQAPPGTFQGALSLGFCPDLAKAGSFCEGNGLHARAVTKGVVFSPVHKVPAPWIVLQGEDDSTCSAAKAAEFVGRIQGAAIVTLPE